MKRYLFVIFLSFCTVVTGVVWLAENQHSQVIESRKRAATERLGKIRAALEGQVTASLSIVRALQTEISLSPDTSSEHYQLLMQGLLVGDLPIRHIALAPDLVIRQVYPLTEKDAIVGFDYRTSPEQYKAVQESIKRQSIFIDGPVQLIQGGWALIVRAPVYTQKQLWGIVAVVIDIDTLLQRSAAGMGDEYRFALKKKNELDKDVVNFGSDAVWNHEHIAIDIQVSTGRWMLALSPKDDHWASRGQTYWLILIAGLLLSVLISNFMYSLVKSRHKLRSALTVIDRQAHFDPVTNLPNRRAFIEHLNELTNAPDCRPFAILFIDLDHFKEVNDNLGHNAGDALLQSVAQRLKYTLRSSDFVARIGGDEFVVVINPYSSTDAINDLALQINQHLNDSFTIENNQVQTSCSIGIALYPDDGSETSDLLKSADLAMYAAKHVGRRTHYFFKQELRQQTERQSALHTRMREGLKRQEFSLVYQPIVDLSTGKITKCEALLRWTDADGTTVSPAEFIPIAERTGFIHELGQFVLEQVCFDWAAMARCGFPMSISINRSERELNDINAAYRWLECIKQHGIPAEKITFEITESLLMSDKQRQLDILHYLRSQGIKLAIDDFGTGYSSINYLQRYPVDFIKIDRSFLNEAPDNRVQVALLTALLGVARALDINVIAEGVETKPQWQLLQAQHCDFAQGYFVSKPLPLNAFLKLLNTWQF